jgi:hypothetical protein
MQNRWLCSTPKGGLRTTAVILAFDLGKYKSTACWYEDGEFDEGECAKAVAGKDVLHVRFRRPNAIATSQCA